MTGLPALVAATVGGSPLWYLSRGTGVVSLVLLTIVVVLGVLTRRGARPGGFTFVLGTVHRNAALLVMVLLAVHVTTAVLDPYAPIRVLDVLVPFGSAYRPVWLGLGALAADLLVALVVTSLLRDRIGLPWWRRVHWLAYLSWPVAVVHGLGTGTDTTAGWQLLLTTACVVAVVAAVLTRASLAADGGPARVLVGGTALTCPLVLAGWLLLGPLAPGWAARSGTPPSLLASRTSSGGSASASAVAGGSSGAPAGASAAPRGSAGWTGAISERDGGQTVIVLAGPLAGGPGGRLQIELAGTPAPGGGVDLASGTVTLLGPDGTTWTGAVTGLDGGRIRAELTGGRPRQTVPVRVSVVLQQDSSGFEGTAVFG
jgi:sulfoxide reductase heme-binding subunit YedZ